MKKHLLLSFLATSLFLGTQRVHGQSTCAQTLRTARATYDQGRLHELQSLLEGCLQNGFSKQEKVEAYKLLTLAFIYLEEPAKADESMLKLLETDPYFQLNESADPAEFVALYKTFRTSPVYRFGIKMGVNASFVNVTAHVSAMENARASYSPAINFQAGAAFEIPLNQLLTLNPEIYFYLRSFRYEQKVQLEEGLQNSTEGMEKQNWISLPVSVQYKFMKSRLNPYVALGISADYLLSAEITLNNIRVNANSTPEQAVTVTGKRNNITISAIASAGIKLRLGGGFVISELRYMHSLSAANEKASAFTIDDASLFDKGYADNEFKLNSLSISAGYVFNVFNPKKLRHK